MKKSIHYFSVVVLLTAAASGQSDLRVYEAEASVPFGRVEGKLMTIGEYLVFVDSEKPESSFAIARTQVERLSAQDGNTVQVVARDAIRDRTGERKSVSFRMKDSSAVASIEGWHASTAASASTSAAHPQADRSADTMSYAARHKHFPAGGCEGRLIVSGDRLIYESLDDAGHTRRWEMSNIKELKRPNPYEVKIVPFSDNEYNLALQGRGMDTPEFRSLVDQIARARSQQR